ncbi:MAG: nitroreductase family protein [Enterococcus sp.]|nr:nitroreductase family protein [Enterococcus sp.]
MQRYHKNTATKSPNADFDCGLACQNMVIAANALGYGVKIVSSTANALNGENHDALCEKLGVDPALTAVAVLLIGYQDDTVDGASGATTRNDFETMVSFVR